MGVGKLAWSLPCRPEISYVTKELAKTLQSPTNLSMLHLLRVLKYLQGTQHLILEMVVDPEQPINNPRMHVDSDWAGSADRKSTSGAVLHVCGFLFLCYSKTQSAISLSSCEAELRASNTGGTEGLYVCNLLSELGVENVQLELCTDSSSNLAAQCKRGPGRMRHLEVRELWMQDQIRAGTIRLTKIPTADNMADLFTKHLTPRNFIAQRDRLGLRVEVPLSQPTLSMLEPDENVVEMLACLEAPQCDVVLL